MCGAIESTCVPDDFCRKIKSVCSNHIVNEEFLLKLLLEDKHKYWVIWAKLIRKNIVEKFPFAEGRIFEDNAVVPQWLHGAKQIIDISEKYYFYQVNDTGTTKSEFSVKRLDILWAMQELIEFCKRVGYIRLKASMENLYLWKLSECHNKIQDNKDYRIVAKKLRRQGKTYLFIKKKIGNLTREDRIFMLETFCPKVMWCYWTGKSLLYKIFRI